LARTFGMAESNVMEIHGKSPGGLRKPCNVISVRTLKFFSIVPALSGLALKMPESQSHFVLIDAAASMAPDVAPSRSTSTTERGGAIFRSGSLFCREEVDQPIHRYKH
jgi:hypothetical protein